jgi:nitrous oxide reductase accessory protein NosL
MVKTVLLWVAAALLLAGCADSSLSDQRRRDTINQAATCAMCGASVSPGYFDYSTQRSMGPGQWW